MKYTTYFSICLALRRKKVYTLITVHSGKVVWKKAQIDNMEEEMKKMVKRTAVVTLAGVMSVGMLSGCGSKTLDGTKTVATVDGTDIPLGVVSLYAREQQQQTTTMYLNYMGSADNIWDQTAGDDSDETYGDQAVTSSLESVEKMYILKEKAADYNVELTDDDEAAIADAASQFMAANSEETIKELAVTEDQVKTLLELQTIQKKMYDPVVAEGKITVSDDEANQTTFTYVSISTSGDDITDEEKKTKKEQAQEILDKMKEDPTADMGETAKAVDDTYSGLTGTIFTNDSDDEDISNSYDDAVVEALRTLKDGEVYGELVETDSSVYVLRMDKVNDEDATASKKESLENTKRSEYYSETTQKWLDDADITVNDKVLSTLTITDEHSFTIKETTADTSEDAADTTDATEDTASEDVEAADESDDADTAETDAAKSDSAEEADTTDSADSTDETAEEDSADSKAEDSSESADSEENAEDTAEETTEEN